MVVDEAFSPPLLDPHNYDWLIHGLKQPPVFYILRHVTSRFIYSIHVNLEMYASIIDWLQLSVAC